LAYAIPFVLIASIVPGEPGACRVTLREGTILDLAGDQDTGDDHAGVLGISNTDPAALVDRHPGRAAGAIDQCVQERPVGVVTHTHFVR